MDLSSIKCFRKIKNNVVKKELQSFIMKQKTNIDDYIISIEDPNIMLTNVGVDIDSSIFMLDIRNIHIVFVEIPFYIMENQKKEFFVGISLELYIKKHHSSKEIIDFLSTDESQILNFRITTSSPGMAFNEPAPFLFSDLDKLDLVSSDEPSFVYFSTTKSKNVYKAHALIQETLTGKILKKFYF